MATDATVIGRAIVGAIVGFFLGVTIGMFADTGIRTIGGAIALFVFSAVVGSVVGATMFGQDANSPGRPYKRPWWARKWP